MGEADGYQVQCPPQVHGPQDRIQHAPENCELHFKKGGMPEHPSESCHIICEGQVFPSSQMFEQQAEMCRRKGTETSEMAGRQRNSRINFNDTNEIQTDDFLVENFIVQFREKLY